MSEHESHEPEANACDQRDMLISRIIDGEASGKHWAEFRALADHDQSIWAELADAQQQQEALAQAVGRAIAVADAVEVPDLIVNAVPLQRRLDLVSRWGGWAAAAAIMLVWLTGWVPTQTTTQPGGPQQAGLLPVSLTPEESLSNYLESGQDAGTVLSAMPERVVRVVPLEDGSFEVVFLRQILERRVVHTVYRTTRDELGNPVRRPVRVLRTVHKPY